MQLVAATLVPVAHHRPALEAEELRELLLRVATPEDRVEHLHVIEHAGIMWVGVYVAIIEPQFAQRVVYELCGRLRSADTGWELIRSD